MGVIKDHCGLLTEESIRKNFILCYEILDELIDFGIPQLSSTTQVMPFIYTDPIAVSNEKITTSGIFTKTAISSNATTAPISQNLSSGNNLFVDLLEKITLLFNAKGSVINSSIDGCIHMKSYLNKSPQVRLQLSPDLSIGNSIMVIPLN